MTYEKKMIIIGKIKNTYFSIFALIKIFLKFNLDRISKCSFLSTEFGGPPHPIHGNIPYISVRKLAKVYLSCTFYETAIPFNS